MDIASSQIVEYKKKLKEASVQERELHSAYNRAKENLDSMDCSKAINEAVQALENAKDEKEKLLDEKNSLDRFQTRVSELLAWFYNEKVDVAEKIYYRLFYWITLQQYRKRIVLINCSRK